MGRNLRDGGTEGQRDRRTEGQKDRSKTEDIGFGIRGSSACGI